MTPHTHRSHATSEIGEQPAYGRATATRNPSIKRSVITSEAYPHSNQGHASEPAPACDQLLDALKAAYRNFRYQEVIMLAEELLERNDATRSHYFNAALYAGAAAYLDGDTALAKQYFQEASAIDPNRRPDRNMFPTAIVQLFKNAQAETDRTRSHSRGQR